MLLPLIMLFLFKLRPAVKQYELRSELWSNKMLTAYHILQLYSYTYSYTNTNARVLMWNYQESAFPVQSNDRTLNDWTWNSIRFVCDLENHPNSILADESIQYEGVCPSPSWYKEHNLFTRLLKNARIFWKRHFSSPSSPELQHSADASIETDHHS